jgi:putative ABC transport system permease protein
MRERGRGVTGDRRFGLSSTLVVGQVALSLVLVAGAGLFMRTFTTLATLDPGFDRDPVLLVSLNTRASSVEPAQRAALFDRVTEAVRAVPGVAGASLSSNITPVSGYVNDFGIEVEHGRKPTDFDLLVVGRLPRDASYGTQITPGWFGVYGTRFVDGRDFTAQDAQGAPRVAIVNETFVRRLLLSGRRAVGQRFRSAFTQPGRPNPWIEVVGVVGDAAYRRLRDELSPTFYVPVAQTIDPDGVFPASLTLSVRAAAGGRSGASARGAAAGLSRGVADAIGRVDPAISITFTPLARQIDDTLVRERILAMLSGFFGGLALLLSGLGLYGLMAYSVSRRRHEIGIRMALGAEARGVVRMVLARVLLLIGAGVAAGVAATMWMSRYVETLLYGVTREDPATLMAAASVLAAVGLAAGWIPARRASRIDPARVLHGE